MWWLLVAYNGWDHGGTIYTDVLAHPTRPKSIVKCDQYTELVAVVELGPESVMIEFDYEQQPDTDLDDGYYPNSGEIVHNGNIEYIVCESQARAEERVKGLGGNPTIVPHDALLKLRNRGVLSVK